MTEDKTLVKNIKEEKCEKSLLKLIERHTPLCYNILQKFYPILSKAGYSKDDVFNDKDFLVYKSAMTFNHEKNTKYSTWLGNYTRYHCLNLLNSRKNHSFVSIEEDSIKSIIEKQSTSDENHTKNAKDHLSYILDQLKDPRVKKIYMMRYFSDDGRKKTWKEIAEAVGVSSQTVINIHNKSKKILKTKLKSRNNYDFV